MARPSTLLVFRALLVASVCAVLSCAFSVEWRARCLPNAVPSSRSPFGRAQTMLFETTGSDAATDSDTTTAVASTNNRDDGIASLRVGEIQRQLKDMGVSYKDCFDRESLTRRLIEAREGRVGLPSTETDEAGAQSAEDGSYAAGARVADKPVSAPFSSPDLGEEPLQSKLTELRSMRVRELREECARRKIRWGSFVEKEELVQAVFADMKASIGFSVSGMVRQGQVAELDGDQLEQELVSSETPILLDIFATWCGPCQMMAPQLQKAAEELGDRVRVVKVDSDKNPSVAQKYRVGGLPTVLVLQDGKVQKRVEGALMKDGLLRMIEPFLAL